MAVIAATPAQVAVLSPERCEIYPFKAAENINAGQPITWDSNGKAVLADANAAGKQQARGVALETVLAGQTVGVLKRGAVGGYTITQAYGARVFLSDTAGALDDAAGTMSVPVGIIMPTSDKDRTKVVYFDFDWSQVFA